MMNQDRSVSAMVRLKNEEEFLEPAILSIADLVDEIVLVDNVSTDRTPEIISRLRETLAVRIDYYEYPHEIRKVGGETWRLAENLPKGDSPHLSSSYYNFALDRCTKPFVLKWDGDMVALDRFREQLVAWRDSGLPVMVFNGANVHPDRRHLIAARSSDREALLAELEVPALPIWATTLTYDYPEPRLFPRQQASYESSMLWTQRLEMPDFDPTPREDHQLTADGPCYLHMKFCKNDPLSNYTADLAEVIRSNIAVGPELGEEELDILRRWGLAS